jgi:protein disulfide-isomerase A6
LFSFFLSFLLSFISDIRITAVDATENAELAERFGVKGYPTIKFFPKGSTAAEEFGGGRTADTIVQ